MTDAAPRAVAGPPDSLAVDADLRISFDGSSGRLTGSGQRLVLHLDSPLDAFGSVPSGSSFRLVGAVGGALRQAGLRMDVVSDRGALLSLGAGLRPRLAGIGTSRAVAFGSPTALLALAWPGALRIAARHRAAAGVGVAVSGVGAAWAVLRLVAGARHRVGASGMTVSRLERDRV